MEELLNKIVSIIIPTGGVRDYLKFCLDSLKKQTYPPFEIVVINNSLNHNFSQDIHKGYPQIQLYISPKNFGDIYLQAKNLKSTEKTPFNKGVVSYRYNPLEVGRYDIQGIDIVF